MSPDFALWIAAGLSALWCGVHVIVGERDVARPLRRSTTLDPLARDTAFLCWHLVSGTLALVTVLFALGITVSPHYAIAGTLLAGEFVVVGFVLPRLIAVSYRQLPQGWLFVPVVALGLWGVWG